MKKFKPMWQCSNFYLANKVCLAESYPLGTIITRTIIYKSRELKANHISKDLTSIFRNIDAILVLSIDD